MDLTVIALTLMFVAFVLMFTAIRFLGAEESRTGPEPVVRTKSRAARKRAKVVAPRRKAA